jgi:hypothetical protein
MSRVPRFDAAAERELNEAVDFYDLESPGLGDVFLAEVEHARSGHGVSRGGGAAPRRGAPTPSAHVSLRAALLAAHR